MDACSSANRRRLVLFLRRNKTRESYGHIIQLHDYVLVHAVVTEAFNRNVLKKSTRIYTYTILGTAALHLQVRRMCITK